MSDETRNTGQEDADMISAEQMMTYEEAQRFLGVSRAMLYFELRLRGIQRFRRGSQRKYLLKKEDVERVKRERDEIRPLES